MADSNGGDSSKRQDKRKPDRGNRLAAALRQNLKRRKAQSRARAASATATPHSGGKVA